jgi:hypothetical protein
VVGGTREVSVGDYHFHHGEGWDGDCVLGEHACNYGRVEGFV